MHEIDVAQIGHYEFQVIPGAVTKGVLPELFLANLKVRDSNPELSGDLAPTAARWDL